MLEGALEQVHWLGWDFHIGHTILAGIYFNDIRFRNETIVYELALQASCPSLIWYHRGIIALVLHFRVYLFP